MRSEGRRVEKNVCSESDLGRYWRKLRDKHLLHMQETTSRSMRL